MKSKHAEIEYLYNRGDLLRLLENFDYSFFSMYFTTYYKVHPLLETAFHWEKTPLGSYYWNDICTQFKKTKLYER